MPSANHRGLGGRPRGVRLRHHDDRPGSLPNLLARHAADQDAVDHPGRRCGDMVPRVEADPLRVAVAGGGVAGLEAILALRAFAGDRVAITLIEPAGEFTYTPMTVVEPFAQPHADRRPLAAIARELDFEHVAEPLARVRPDDHVAVTGNGTEVAYDALLLALGGRRRPAYEHALTFRGREDADALHGLIQDIEG